MSNLGNYITLTRVSKLLGGPEMFVGVIFATGFVSGVVVKSGIEKVKNIYQEHNRNREA